MTVTVTSFLWLVDSAEIKAVALSALITTSGIWPKDVSYVFWFLKVVCLVCRLNAGTVSSGVFQTGN